MVGRLFYRPEGVLPVYLRLHSMLKFNAFFARRRQRLLLRSHGSLLAWATKKAVVLTLLFYKGTISPLLPSLCKFHPTCSIYAVEAVERYGVRKGLWLAAKRLLRCRPFSQGGYDPVSHA